MDILPTIVILLPSRIASPTFGHFLGHHVWIGTVDKSAFSTTNRRSLFLSLTCLVMHSYLSKCSSSLVLFTCLLLLRYLCRLTGRCILFILIGAWNATAVDRKRCATKSACCLFPSPSAPMILRATLSGIFSGVDNDDFVTILVKRVTCLLKCYDTQCLGVCEKPLLNPWTVAMMLENGILPRKHSSCSYSHACLKVNDDPGNFRSRHSPLCEDTLIAQIEGRTMHLQLFILLLGFLVESND